MDLGDKGSFRGWKCNFGIYEPIGLIYTSKCSQWNIKPSSSIWIWGKRMDLGDGGRFRGWKCNFDIYEPIWLFYTSKCSQKKIKVGYLSHLLGFDVFGIFLPVPTPPPLKTHYYVGTDNRPRLTSDILLTMSYPPDPYHQSLGSL